MGVVTDDIPQHGLLLRNYRARILAKVAYSGKATARCAVDPGSWPRLIFNSCWVIVLIVLGYISIYTDIPLINYS